MAIQRKDFSVSGKSASGAITYTFILRVRENKVNTANNTSNLTVWAILKSSYTGLSFSTWGTGVSCTLNGTQIFSEYKQRRCEGGKEHRYYTWTGDVSHNDDGTLLLKVGGKLWQNNSDTFTPPTLTIVESDDNTMALRVIKRQHKISAASSNIEETAMIAITNSGDTLTHSLQYSFGNLSGYIDSAGNPVTSEVKFTNTSVGFKVPKSFYAQIPDKKYGKCTLTCRTYSANTLVGDITQDSFTATAAQERCTPVVSGTVVDCNSKTIALTGDPNKLVRYCSDALCTIAATAKNSASISAKKIAGKTVSGNTLTIPAVESGSFSFWVEDSRGYEAAAEPVTKTLIPYVKLTNNAAGVRTDPTNGNAQIRFAGDYYSGSFGAVSNTLSVKYRKSGDTDWISVTPAFSGNKYSAAVNLSGLDYTKTYRYEVQVKDKLDEVTKTVTVGQGMPVFHWNQDSFSVNVASSIPLGYVSYLDNGDDATEKNLENKLDKELAEMPNNTAKFMEIHSRAVNNYRYMGYLYRANYSYAAFFGICYDGTMVRKRKFEGQWHASIVF